MRNIDEYKSNHICSWIYCILFNTLYAKSMNELLFNPFYAKSMNELINLDITFYNLYVKIRNKFCNFLDVYFHRNICCECGKIISLDAMYTRISMIKYRHDECFNYYSRSAQ